MYDRIAQLKGLDRAKKIELQRATLDLDLDLSKVNGYHEPVFPAVRLLEQLRELAQKPGLEKLADARLTLPGPARWTRPKQAAAGRRDERGRRWGAGR